MRFIRRSLSARLLDPDDRVSYQTLQMSDSIMMVLKPDESTGS